MGRLGPRYITLFWAFVAVTSFLLTGLWAVLLVRLIELPVQGSVQLIALALCLEVVCRTGLWVLVYRPSSAPIRSWLARHDQENGAEAAWDAMRRAPIRGFAHSGWSWVLIVALPVLLVASNEVGLSALDVLAGLGASTVAVTFNLLLAVLQAERAMRPIRLAVWPSLEDRRVSVPTYPLRQRLTIALPLIALLTTLAVAYVATLDDPSLSRFGVYLIVGGLTTATASGLLTWLLAKSIVVPVEELMDAVARVQSGDLAFELTPTSEDELGVLASNFNQMTRGLLERDRLHGAFGSYVDPDLAERLLLQGDDLFAGEEVEVSVFFVDIRDFTAYSERVAAREAVGRLNKLFGVVVPILREHHGHANKFSGDGVLAVFGTPEQIENHADLAVSAACEVQRCVREAFGEGLRIGIGINTGRVVAGSVGGGGKLEFALIGDAVNVAARVEQLTKETGDAILLTQTTLDSLRERPAGLASRGSHYVKGKSEPIAVYGLAR